MRAIGLGAGGHAKVVIETLRSAGEWEIVGLLDLNRDLWNTEMLGVPVLGDDTRIADLMSEGVTHAFIGAGSVGDTGARRRLAETIAQSGLEPITVIHPAAVVSPRAVLGAGVTVMAGAVINADSRLGDHVTINTRAVVEHDCVIGDFAHIAPGACLGGNVSVGDDSHIGLGASVLQGVCIGAGAIVGAGACVIRPVDDRATVAGVPAQPLRGAGR